jgi:hypothetical protein
MARIDVIVTAVIAGGVTGSRSAGCVGSVAGRISTVGGIAVAAVAVSLDIRVNLVGFAGPFAYVVAQRPGLGGLLVRVLAQAGGFDLGLLCIRPGTGCLRFTFTGLEFPVLGFPSDFRSLLAVRVVPLLLNCLPAPSCCEQEHHNQHHHNYGNYHPNPRSYFQNTHHFHLAVTGPAEAIPADFLEPFTTRLASVLTFY